MREHKEMACKGQKEAKGMKKPKKKTAKVEHKHSKAALHEAHMHMRKHGG
jgi:hypothetical protein